MTRWQSKTASERNHVFGFSSMDEILLLCLISYDCVENVMTGTDWKQIGSTERYQMDDIKAAR